MKSIPLVSCYVVTPFNNGRAIQGSITESQGYKDLRYLPELGVVAMRCVVNEIPRDVLIPTTNVTGMQAEAGALAAASASNITGSMAETLDALAEMHVPEPVEPEAEPRPRRRA